MRRLTIGFTFLALCSRSTGFTPPCALKICRRYCPTPRFSVSQGDENNPRASSSPLSTKTTFRQVHHIQKFSRLPVWPAWNGVLIWLVSLVLGSDRAAQLENVITGRVCPNFFQADENSAPYDCSPFLMLVHHCHTFAPIDPLRFIQRAFFPEGFPAHPHRGFITLTYFLEGGFRHRDSLGVEQVYGQKIRFKDDDDSESKEKGAVPHHSQWLYTGAGILHEEMFYQAKWWHWQRQELYQLWINVPSVDKMNPPHVLLMGDKTETPVVQETGIQCRVLAGQYDDHHRARVPTASDLTVLHVTLEVDTLWTYAVPETYETLIVYVRTGTLRVSDTDGRITKDEDTTVRTIAPHHTAFFGNHGGQQALRVMAVGGGADFMVLSGVPLRERVAAQGSMVMNEPDEIEMAYRDYQRGLFGSPWPHTLAKEEWLAHVRQNPSAYGTTDGFSNPLDSTM